MINKLKDLNSRKKKKHYVYGSFSTYLQYAVGTMNHTNSGTSTSNIKHLIFMEVVSHISENTDAAKELSIGDIYATRTPCNRNGQFTGTPMKGLDTDYITCKKCLKVLRDFKDPT